MEFLGKGIQTLQLEQTDKNTNARDRKHYHAVFVGDGKIC